MPTGYLSSLFLSFLKCYLFISLFLAELDLRCCPWAFSSCSEWGATLHCSVLASHCSSFFCCGAGPLGMLASVFAAVRFSSCGSLCSVVVWAGAQLPHGMWTLPRPGIRPASPALAGGVPFIVPLGNSSSSYICSFCLLLLAGKQCFVLKVLWFVGSIFYI